MELFGTSKIDRDFNGGIYLSPFGEIPPLDSVVETAVEGELYLPLAVDPDVPMKAVVKEGDCVAGGALLSENKAGHKLYAPRDGIVGRQERAGYGDRNKQPVLVLKPPAPDKPVDFLVLPTEVSPIPPTDIATDYGQESAVLHAIECAGLVLPGSGKPLRETLLKWQQEQRIKTVIANATPPEPSLNTPLAILHCFPEQVFAGLSILKQWLGARRAVMAYPHHFEVDRRAAEQWDVECLPMSEKYPQARSASIVRTLQRQRHLPRGGRGRRTAVVFDMQMLRQLGRLILAGQLPTERIVTIAGDGVKHPAHFRAPLGLPLKRLLETAGIYDDAECVVDGSSMTGTAIDSEQTVIGFDSEAFMVIHRFPGTAAQSCIRCGWCIDDCPAQIDPVGLLHLIESGRSRQAAKKGLFTCVECGICSYICPASLPLMQRIRETMREIKAESDY